MITVGVCAEGEGSGLSAPARDQDANDAAAGIASVAIALLGVKQFDARG
jgi:hypothetical protein